MIFRFKNGYRKVHLPVQSVMNPEHFPDGFTYVHSIFENRKKQGVGLIEEKKLKYGETCYLLAKWKDDVQIEDTVFVFDEFNETTMIKKGLLVELAEKQDRINKIKKPMNSEDLSNELKQSDIFITASQKRSLFKFFNRSTTLWTSFYRIK